MQHLRECIASFSSVAHLAERPAEVEAALWFHDAVYALRAGDNEEQSARLAQSALRACGVSIATTDRIAQLVLATKHTALPSLPDAQLLVDIDLSILGAPVARFGEYEHQIREEYAFVTESVFKAKRGEVLQAFLARPRIYSTEHFHARLEQTARDNIARS